MTYEIKRLDRAMLSRLEELAPTLVMCAKVGMGTPLRPDEALSLIQFAVWNRDRIEQPAEDSGASWPVEGAPS